jgi:RNA polymerase sigma factor (sigma-70 family)
MLPDIRKVVGARSLHLVTVEPEDGDGSQPDAPHRADAAHATRFRTLFDAEYRSILQYCLRRVDEPEDAADVLAETFLVAWRRFDDVPAGKDARFWLYGVARRVLANARRGEQRRDRLAERLRDHLRTAERPVAVSAGEELRVLLAGLDDDDRELLTLIAWEDLTPAEAGRVLGISAGTARVRLHRARRRLRRALRSDEGATS